MRHKRDVKNNLSLHKKTFIIMKITKMELLIAFIFYHIKAVKQVHYMTWFFNFRTLFCDAADAKSTDR